MFGVSRITVRHAIDKLVASNLVRRQQGVGTHVIGADQAVKTASLVGYIDDVHPHINFRLLSSGMREPPATLAASMRLAPGTACRCFVNLNHVGSEPLSYVESFFPDEVARFLSDEDFSSHIPPSRLVEMRSGRAFAHANQTMGAVAAPPHIADLLGLHAGQPLIRMERTYFATDGGVLEATVAHYHPQRYQFSIRLVPHGGAAARDARGNASKGLTQTPPPSPPPEGPQR
jgi:GntR family transcriptional regulator